MTLATSDNYYAGDPLLVLQVRAGGRILARNPRRALPGERPTGRTASRSTTGPSSRRRMPLAVRPGAETKLSLVGFNLPADAARSCQSSGRLPAGCGGSRRPSAVRPPTNSPCSSPDWPLPPRRPLPRCRRGTTLAASGQSFTVPRVINGRIETPGEIGPFRLRGQSGRQVVVRSLRPAGRSGLDPIIRILNDKGAALSEADDMTQSTASASPTRGSKTGPLPPTASSLLEIRDLHLRGGPQYTYAVQVTRTEPYFLLEADTDKTLLAPGRQRASSTSAGCARTVSPARFNSPSKGLPPGVTAVCGKILAERPTTDA